MNIIQWQIAEIFNPLKNIITMLTAKYINNGEEQSVTFKTLDLLNSFFDFTNPCTEFGINLCGSLRLNSNRFNGIVYITKYRAKTFLWKSTDGRGEPSSPHPEQQSNKKHLIRPRRKN